eukprot:766511-Hanusia_phi.AAC.1
MQTQQRCNLSKVTVIHLVIHIRFLYPRGSVRIRSSRRCQTRATGRLFRDNTKTRPHTGEERVQRGMGHEGGWRLDKEGQAKIM